MSENSKADNAAGAADAEPTTEELREFGRGWIEYLGLDPEELVTYRRGDGSELTFALGDVAIVSPHSIPAFNRLGELIAEAERGGSQQAVDVQTATIMGFVKHYRGH